MYHVYMISKWIHLKEEAIRLRLEGESIVSIEVILAIPRSTLNGWFKSIVLTNTQKQVLRRRSELGLISARKKASEWHRASKSQRIATMKEEVSESFQQLSKIDSNTLEVALAFLYLGEGVKNTRTAMGNSDPQILRFFVHCMITLYNVPLEKIKCALHLRADQEPEELKKYWSKKLQIPLVNFTKPSRDLRTLGRPTYETYKGVCLVECGRVDIQRRLMYIAERFCEMTEQN